MLIARWIIAGLLGAVFTYLAVGNLYLVLKPLFGRKPESWIPLIGGVSGTLACLIAPSIEIRAWWWLPLLLDFGTLPGSVWTGVYLLWRRQRPPNSG